MIHRQSGAQDLVQGLETVGRRTRDLEELELRNLQLGDVDQMA